MDPRKRCTVCRSGRLAEVDAALLAGEPAASVARRFDLGERAVQRHVTRCLAPRIAEASRHAEVEALSPEQLLAQVTAVQAHALELVRAAETSGDLKERAAAIRELRSTVELLAKLSFAAADRPRAIEEGARPDIDAAILDALASSGNIGFSSCPRCGADLSGTDMEGAARAPLALPAGADIEEAEVVEE